MCNRLRVLSTAIVVGAHLGRRVVHCWNHDLLKDHLTHESSAPSAREMAAISLHDVFDISDLDVVDPAMTGKVDLCLSEWLPGQYWYGAQSAGQRRLRVTNIEAHGNDITGALMRNDETAVILLETSHALQRPASMTEEQWETALHEAYHAHFCPKQEYHEVISQVPEYASGVSVRRGDLLQYFPEARQSLLELGVWLTKLPAPVLLFSDDPSARNFLQQFLKGEPHDGIARLQNLADPHNSLQRRRATERQPPWLPWQQGLLEFLCLAMRCDKVFGTPASSFGREAARFGNRPFQLNLS